MQKMKLVYGFLTFLIAMFPVWAISQEITALKASPKFNKLKNCNIGYLTFIPLSKNYPSGYFPNERVFTGELYSKDSGSAIAIEDDIFVPKDYMNILETGFTNTLKYALLQPKKYTSLQDARSDGIPVVIWGTPIVFKVMNETHAKVEIYYRIYDTDKEEILWEGKISSSFDHIRLPSSLKNDKGKKVDIFMTGRHQYNFQPQRALLALAVHNNTVDLMIKLNEYLE